MKKKRLVKKLSRNEFIDTWREKGKTDSEIFNEIEEHYPSETKATIKSIRTRPLPYFISNFSFFRVLTIVSLISIILYRSVSMIEYKAYLLNTQYIYPNLNFILLIICLIGILKHIKWSYLTVILLLAFDLFLIHKNMRNQEFFRHGYLAFVTLLSSAVTMSQYYLTSYSLKAIKANNTSTLFPTNIADTVAKPKGMKVLLNILYAMFFISSFVLVLTISHNNSEVFTRTIIVSTIVGLVFFFKRLDNKIWSLVLFSASCIFQMGFSFIFYGFLNQPGWTSHYPIINAHLCGVTLILALSILYFLRFKFWSLSNKVPSRNPPSVPDF